MGPTTVAHVLADGSGRLHVMLVQGFDGEPPSRLPTDVYSSQGDLVAAGYLPASWPEFSSWARAPWSHAAGDHVYGLRPTDSGEVIAVRYRLTVSER